MSTDTIARVEDTGLGSATPTSKKRALVAEICMELTVHSQLEEEIFYPAVKAALRDKELVPEATVEHASVKDLISQVRDAEPGGEEYDARLPSSIAGRHWTKKGRDRCGPS